MLDSCYLSPTHLESSGPFNITDWRNHCFQVWKRIEGALRWSNFSAQGEPWPRNRMQQHETLANGEETYCAEEQDSSPMFKYHCCLIMPMPRYCFKARAPYLAARSYRGQRVYT